MGIIPLFLNNTEVNSLKVNNTDINKIIYNNSTLFEKMTVNITFNTTAASYLKNTTLMQVQTWSYNKNGTGQYITRATIATNASGNISYSGNFVVNKGTKIRLVFPIITASGFARQARTIAQINSSKTEIKSWNDYFSNPIILESNAINLNTTMNITSTDIGSGLFFAGLSQTIEVSGINSQFFTQV